MAPEDQFEIHDGGRGCGVSDRGLRNLTEYLDEMSGEYNPEYYIKNRERMIASSRKYYAENRDKIIEKSRAFRAANPEFSKTVDRYYYEKNREANIKRSNDRNKRIRAEKAKLCEVVK